MVFEPISRVVDVQNIAGLCDILSNLSEYGAVDVLARWTVYVGHTITSLQPLATETIEGREEKTAFNHRSLRNVFSSSSHHFENHRELGWNIRDLLGVGVVVERE